MRETRSSGSVEGVMGDHDSYSDSLEHDLGLILGPERNRSQGKAACRYCPRERGALMLPIPRTFAVL
jgi:hypothetical protein